MELREGWREWDRRELPSEEEKGEEYNSKQGFRTRDIDVLFLWLMLQY